MPPKISPHDQAKLGAAAGGILLLWVGVAGLLILIPLGVVFLTSGKTIAGATLIGIGVLLFIFVLARHFRIVRRNNSEESFFPDK